jgi:ADP-ribosyl-[dinitrogen reductase] hydrolase
MLEKDRFLGCFVGLATGDALGAPLEFFPRGSFEPISDMIEGGYFHLLKGEWTDDTSMALCLAESLLECGGFDARDQMDRYAQWAYHGYFSSRPRSFGFGQTFLQSIMLYRRTNDPFAGSLRPKRAGNGCIMRLAPIPIYFFPDLEQVIHWAGESSRTTHGMPECIHASRLFARIIFAALEGKTKHEVLFNHPVEPEAPQNIHQIAEGLYQDKTEDEIDGTFFAGKSLEAALWCFMHTDNFRDALIKAVNLGGDTDSTAAVCGQVAGAYYGFQAIPSNWVAVLAKRDVILEMAEKLFAQGPELEVGS